MCPSNDKSGGFGLQVVVLELNANTHSECIIVHPIEVDPDEGGISLSARRAAGARRP